MSNRAGGSGGNRVGGTTRVQTGRATADRRTKVAVWDVDEVFPGLERTLDVMNHAQDAFAFELARLSAPLDVWYVDPQEDC